MKKEIFIENIFNDHIKLIEDIRNCEIKKIDYICNQFLKVIKNNSTIFFCGNGGSAADSQHLAAEFVCRFEKDRIPLKALALTVDTSVLTSISNDYNFETIFSRQIEAFAKKGDLLVAMSTSGNSKNIVNALKKANEKEVKTLSLLGNDGGEAKKFSDLKFIVPSTSTARIQEAHILIGHVICSYIDREIVK